MYKKQTLTQKPMQQSTPHINHLISLRTRNQYLPPSNLFVSKMAGKIDVNHHTLPEFYRTALSSAGDVSGAPVQPWSLDASSSLMTKLSISTSILSLSAPGAEIAGSPAKGDAASGRALARKWNDYAVSLRANQPDKFGFFGALPSLTDVEGAIEALKYALDELKADGITLFTSYDGKVSRPQGLRAHLGRAR